jgi:hypothetical protein
MGGGGWQAKTGMKIIGSGTDVTTLQLVRSGVGVAHYYTIGHVLSTSGSQSQPVTVDFFEVSDLTTDCNLSNISGSQVACGAVKRCQSMCQSMIMCYFH